MSSAPQAQVESTKELKRVFPVLTIEKESNHVESTKELKRMLWACMLIHLSYLVESTKELKLDNETSRDC